MFFRNNIYSSLFTSKNNLFALEILNMLFSNISNATNPEDLYLIGDCPNIEIKTLGGKKFWKNIENQNGLRLQQNIITGLCRILDENNVRKAWGNRFSMEEKLKRLTRAEFLEAGDIIGVDRIGGIYQHYAVYLGNSRVIHYQGERNDFSFSEAITIHESPLKDFLKEDKNYFVLLFDENKKNVIKLRSRTEFLEAEVLDRSIFNDSNFHLYSSEQTIERVKNLLGENKYNLLFRNCEHIAVWCKTNVSCSFQVNKVLNLAENSIESNPLSAFI